LILIAEVSSPVPEPTHSSIGIFVKYDINNEAAEVFPIPISPKPIVLHPLLNVSATKSAPFCIASVHCATVIAGFS
jgi:hypothetical protein